MLKGYSFKDQTGWAAISISNNIAEGFDRYSAKDYLQQFLEIERCPANEIKSMLHLSSRLNSVSLGEKERLVFKTEEVIKMIVGLSKAIIKKNEL